MAEVNHKSEILFCYDITDNNPNGDPADGNKPRVDDETKINLVTDVRLKRTVRDYLYENEGYDGDILVRTTASEKGIKDGIERGSDFGKSDEGIRKNVIEKCIDARLFGATIPRDKSSVTFTGPVQFQMGRSLHKIDTMHIKGTGAFASKAGKGQQTFREEYVLPYSFICFHGIINDFAAKQTHLSEDDVTLMLKAMWLGTKGLISRSKVGQMPRLLLKIDYAEGGFFIGDLQRLVKVIDCEIEENIRDPKDFTLDLSELKKVLENEKNKITNISYKADSRLNTNIKLEELLPGKMSKIEDF